MPRFKGEYAETFTVGAPLEATKSHFADLPTIAEHYGDVQSHEVVDGGRLKLVLNPKSEVGLTFQGAYTGLYRFSSPDTLEWSTVETKNMWSTGRARFRAVTENKTQVEFWQKIECEMQVNALLGKLIQPIVTREINSGVKGYLARMRSALEQATRSA